MIGGLLKSTSRLALVAAAGFLVGGVAMPSAKAADLGGDCCADLEERVAELEATTARKGNRKVSLIISGQVNTAVMAWDDGIRNDVYIVDNGVSRSAFQLDGSARISPTLTAGFNMVFAMATGARSHQVSQLDDDGGAAGDSTLGIELANWYLDSKTLGRLTLGRINGASAGSTQVDLGNVGVIANANILLWNGSMFVTQGAANTPDTVTWGALMGGNILGISGLNRSNAIRYDTPTFGGFTLGASWGEDDMWDVAARYAGEFGGFRLAAAVSYSRNACGVNDCNDTAPYTDPLKGAEENKWQGSASIMHVPTGLFLSGAFAQLSHDGSSPGDFNTFTGGPLVAGARRPDAKLWYVVGGISKNWFGMGNTALYGEWSRITDGASGLTIGGDSIWDSEVNMWGLGVVQNIDAAAMELFLSYRQYQAEFGSLAGGPFGTATGLNDMNIVMAGARIKF
jgi:predicted porin